MHVSSGGSASISGLETQRQKRISLNRHRSRDVRVPNRPRSRGDAQRDRRHSQEQNTEQRHIELLAGVIRNTSAAPVAHLQIARAQKMMGDEACARKWFEDFLNLWKDADPDQNLPANQDRVCQAPKMNCDDSTTGGAVRLRSKHPAGCLSPRASGTLWSGHMQLRLVVPVFLQRLLPVLCIALNSCQSHKANSGPSIEFTHIPPAAQGGRGKVDTTSGRVRNARPKQQIVIYAHSRQWWVQPWPPYLGS